MGWQRKLDNRAGFLKGSIECTVTVTQHCHRNRRNLKTLTELGITAYSNDDIGFVRIAL